MFKPTRTNQDTAEKIATILGNFGCKKAAAIAWAVANLSAAEKAEGKEETAGQGS